MPATPIPRQPEISETEAKMLGLARRHIAQYGYPVGDLAVRRMVHALQDALPRRRPTEREVRLPADLLARCEAQAPNREAAEKRVVRKPAAVPVEPVVPLSPVERLRADPVARAVASLVADDWSNRQISDRLGLPLWRVKRRTSDWLKASEQDDRAALGAWLRRTGVLEPKGVRA